MDFMLLVCHVCHRVPPRRQNRNTILDKSSPGVSNKPKYRWHFLLLRDTQMVCFFVIFSYLSSCSSISGNCLQCSWLGLIQLLGLYISYCTQYLHPFYLWSKSSLARILKVAARANRDVLVQPLRIYLGTYNFACVAYLYIESHRLKFDPLYPLFPYKELCSNMEKSSECPDFKLIFFFSVLKNKCFEDMDMIKIAKGWNVRH